MIGVSGFAAMVLALAGSAPVSAAPLQEQAPVQDEADAARQLVFLAEHRPIFVRLRVQSEGRPFEASWIDSIRILHECLDRNGDGTLTTKEADPKIVAGLVRLAMGAAAAVPDLGELDVQPKDGKVSIEELAEALRAVLGPFRLQIARQAVSRTDALFDQLDRDKDGALTRPELSAIAGSLRPLDLDDNEMITPDELEPFNSPALLAVMEASSDRNARLTALPPVVELVGGESTLRPARLLLKKYDKGKNDEPGRPDGKLSASEFPIDPDSFARFDRNKDEALDTQELRAFLGRAPVDLTLEVTLSPRASGGSKVRVAQGEGEGGASRKGAEVRQLADGDVEIALGQVRLDIQVDEGNALPVEARRVLEQRFKLADTNKDGYLEGKERAALDGPQSPLAGLADAIDRDGDGKIYLKEILAFGERQVEAARRRLVVATADQGRAIFGIVDLDRDRRLGAREILRTVERVMTWDGDGDGRVSADEIPYHFQVTISRGGLPGLTGGAGVVVNPGSSFIGTVRRAGATTGPDWFEKMDRNHDGDISYREFLGPRDQYDRLDRDKDGLIDADEAREAVPVPAKPRDEPAPEEPRKP